MSIDVKKIFLFIPKQIRNEKNLIEKRTLLSVGEMQEELVFIPIGDVEIERIRKFYLEKEKIRTTGLKRGREKKMKQQRPS